MDNSNMASDVSHTAAKPSVGTDLSAEELQKQRGKELVSRNEGHVSSFYN